MTNNKPYHKLNLEQLEQGCTESVVLDTDRNKNYKGTVNVT